MSVTGACTCKSGHAAAAHSSQCEQLFSRPNRYVNGFVPSGKTATSSELKNDWESQLPAQRVPRACRAQKCRAVAAIWHKHHMQYTDAAVPAHCSVQGLAPELAGVLVCKHTVASNARCSCKPSSYLVQFLNLWTHLLL